MKPITKILIIEIPPGFTFDEASHALDALDILHGRFSFISPRLQQTMFKQEMRPTWLNHPTGTG